MSALLDLPRRASTCTDDPRYDPIVASGAVRIDVWLDGVKQKQVCTYDMDEGLIVRCKLNHDGYAYVDPATGDVALETLHGVVTAGLIKTGLLPA